MTAGTENFYGWTAGAAATLLGLLFVAIQISFGRLSYDPGDRRHAMARSTFSIFVTIMLGSLVFLWPGATRGLAGEAVAIFSAFGAQAVVRTWLPVWRGMIREHRLERAWQTAWLLVGPLICYGVLAWSSYRQFTHPADAIVETTAPGPMLGLITIAIRNAWNLVGGSAVGGGPGTD